MMGRRKVDAVLLHKLWHSDMETADIALRLGVSLTTLHNVRQKYGLPKRPPKEPPESEAPSPEEEAASLSGLALSPWVAERALPCRERHYAERRGETDKTTKQWRRGGVA
jgi:hypothetical protein